MYRWYSVFLASCLFIASSHAQTGITSTEIVIGQVAPFTGRSSQLGRRLYDGIHAHFKTVNAQGGIHGRQLRLLAYDDGYDPAQSVARIEKLIAEDAVFAFIGSVGTPTGLAIAPVVTAAQVPLVGMFTGAPKLRDAQFDTIFHIRASYQDETAQIIEQIRAKNLDKVAVFYQNDAYGETGLMGVRDALAAHGLSPVGLGTVERNSTDVSAALERILAAQPEVVVQIGSYQACAQFIQQARARGFQGQFFNVSFVGSAALALALGPTGQGVTIAQVVPFPFDTSIAVVQEYQTAMRAVGKEAFDFSSLEGFLMAKVLAEGLRRSSSAPSRQEFITTLESMHHFDLGGFVIGFTPDNHAGSGVVELTTITADGQFSR